MSDMPQSPRERILREAEIEQAEHNYDPATLDDPVVAKLAEAAEAAAAARAEGPRIDFDPEQEEQAEAQEVITVSEIEAQLTRLDHLLGISDEMPLHQLLMEADDALQGITVILGMGFGGDVQTMVLAALQRYRKIKHY